MVEPTPAKPKLNEIVVLSSDEGWVKQEIMRSAYTLEFPGEIDWKVTDGGEYIAFRASSLHEGRSYAVWGHRYIATAAGLQNPDLLDESYVGFALSSGGAAHERSDRAVGRDVATGLGGRFTFDMDGDTYFADLVVFRVDNVVFLLSMTTKGAYGPEADFARMVDSFSPTASAE